MISFAQNTHLSVQNLQNLHPTFGKKSIVIENNESTKKRYHEKVHPSSNQSFWVRNNRFILFPNNKKISTTRDDWDSKPGLIASRIDDMWRKVQFHIDSRSSIFLHVKNI